MQAALRYAIGAACALVLLAAPLALLGVATDRYGWFGGKAEGVLMDDLPSYLCSALATICLVLADVRDK